MAKRSFGVERRQCIAIEARMFGESPAFLEEQVAQRLRSRFDGSIGPSALPRCAIASRCSRLMCRSATSTSQPHAGRRDRRALSSES